MNVKNQGRIQNFWIRASYLLSGVDLYAIFLKMPHENAILDSKRGSSKPHEPTLDPPLQIVLIFSYVYRDAATTHLVSLDDYGGVTAGNKSNVINAIQQGHGVRINTLESRYSFPADVLEYNAANDLAAATALWHVSQEDVTRDGVTVKDFKVP